MGSVSGETRGVLITLEGDDGVGKSTQADLLAAHFEGRGYAVLRVHEPGGTQLGEKIRNLLLSKEQEGMSPLAELLLYEAARSQVMDEVIRPALENGKVVICDRFTDSTLAYQGYGRKLGEELVKSLNALACDGVKPSRTLLLLLDSEIARDRVLSRAEDDRMEAAGDDFHERLRLGFFEIANADPERVHQIDASGSVDEVFERICDDIADLFDSGDLWGDGA